MQVRGSGTSECTKNVTSETRVMYNCCIADDDTYQHKRIWVSPARTGEKGSEFLSTGGIGDTSHRNMEYHNFMPKSIARQQDQ